MTEHVLITGGAGFIGSHVAAELLAAGYRVRVLDALVPQVHGEGMARPDYLHPDIELRVGDVRNPDAVAKALTGVDAVLHFAAAVGVGQSMYEIAHYTDVNNLGTAVLLEALAQQPVRRLIVASSMSIYGEGLYRTQGGEPYTPPERGLAQLKAGRWELTDADGRPLEPVPTPESKLASPSSVYALSKYDQERLCLLVGAAYDIPTVALRFFNVYGPHQSLSNPYTGVLSIFASRYLNGRPPVIFEDGLQQRDFVSVHDVARACRLAVATRQAAGVAINVGSGRVYTIAEVAERMGRVLGCEDLQPEYPGRYRVGDIRHCFADIGRAETLLGYAPQVGFEQGLVGLAQWLEGQIAIDHGDRARQELTERGLCI